MKNPSQLKVSISELVQSFIQFPETETLKRAAIVWVVLLYVAGALAWGYFFSWGNVHMDFHDWAIITGPRLQFLKDAVTHLELPLHISETSTFDEVSDRYLSVPDAFTAPQAILLRWMDVGRFVFVDTLLLYTIGFWGLLLIRHRFRLSSAAFFVLFLLFNFNGHIIAHYAVGHATWGGYFLFPFFVILIIELLEGKHGWGWVAKMAILMGAIFLQGSFHQFVWLLIFLILTAVSIPKYFWMCAKGAFFSVMISMFRILPPALLIGQFDNKFISGYPTIDYIWKALVEVAVPGDITIASDMTAPIGWWEFTLYIGLVGVLFLIGFGLVRWLSTKQPAIDPRLLIPMTGLTFLAMGNIYKFVQKIPVPLFAGERVSSRMISVVFVFLLVVAVIEFQRWMDSRQHNPWISVGTGLATLFVAQDLWQNLKLWQVNHVQPLFPDRTFTPSTWFVKNNYGDGGYLALIALGLVLSAATLALLGWLTLREHQKTTHAA